MNKANKYIDRPSYLASLEPFMNKPLVKILTGVRRCGKSTIFSMLHDKLLQKGINDSNIITRLFTEIDIPNGFTAREMFDDIHADIQDKGRCYLLLDEVQEIPGWEKAVNNLLEKCDVDIYITGSNSKLLSSEISTYLTGRFVSIPVFTLSFEEYIVFRTKNNSANHVQDSSNLNASLSLETQNHLLEQYIRQGGFPLIAAHNFNDQAAYQVVNDVFHTVVSRDIVRRHKIMKQDLFERVVQFIIENVGKTFSANSIAKFMKSQHRSISVETIYNYLRWLEQAFIIYPCKRFDLTGKQILKTQEKFYLSDISFKYSMFGYSRSMLDGVLENIVFLELKRRGYDVFVGKYGTKEIDFVALKNNERIYVQACVQLPATSSREIDNLLSIKDAFPKYVITLNSLDTGTEDGVKIIHLADFLLSNCY